MRSMVGKSFSLFYMDLRHDCGMAMMAETSVGVVN